MQIFNVKNDVESAIEGAVIAIGNFDGVHKGHAAIIRQVLELAKKAGKPAGVLTFNPSPYTFFLHAKEHNITPFKEKAKILDAMGLDMVSFAEFNQEFSEVSAEDFVKDILVKKLKVTHVFTGEDFKFGHKAKGDSRLLAELAKKYGFGYTAVAKINDEIGKRYSSTEAVKAIENGRVDMAEKILGRRFAICGKVLQGKKLARTLGYPTANMSLDGYVMPKFGVYECCAVVDGVRHKAIANIGVKPTYGDNKPLLEVHILNFDDNLYIKNILVELVRFIREERKFGSVEELKIQIGKDVENVR